LLPLRPFLFQRQFGIRIVARGKREKTRKSGNVNRKTAGIISPSPLYCPGTGISPAARLLPILL
jgi:hypothetical protein